MSWRTVLSVSRRKLREAGSVAGITAAAALASALAALYLNQAADRGVTAQTFLELRQHYLAMEPELSQIRATDPVPVDDEDPRWQVIKRYWYQAFDEWYVTNHLKAGNLESLWKGYYRKPIAQSLRKPQFRGVACQLQDWNPEPGPFHDFLTELSSIYAQECPHGPAMCTRPLAACKP